VYDDAKKIFVWAMLSMMMARSSIGIGHGAAAEY